MKIDPPLDVQVFLDFDTGNPDNERDPEELTITSAELEDDTIWVYVLPNADAQRVLQHVAGIPLTRIGGHDHITTSMPNDIIEAARRAL